MTVYLKACLLVWEVTAPRKVEQHGIIITDMLTIRRPINAGVTAYAVTIF